MGIKGAAWASLIAQVIMALLSLILLLKKTDISLRLRFPLHPEVNRLVSMSANLFVRSLALNVALMLAVREATALGKEQIAAHAIAINLWLFAAFFLDGYGAAGNILSGKLKGEGAYSTLIRLAKKVNAGANFIQTQLVYDVPAFAEYMQKVRDLGLHKRTFILAGVGPLKSPGMARYMKNNVPGILVPDKLIERMNASGEPWAGKEELSKEDKKARAKAWKSEGIQICIELIQQLRQIEGVAGVHIMAIEWEEAVKPIVEGAGLYPRPDIKEEAASAV